MPPNPNLQNDPIPQNDPDRYDAFISYSNHDLPRVRELIHAITEQHKAFTGGREPQYFFDKLEIHHGHDWQITLRHAIAESRLFIAFVSHNYLNSPWCKKEWTAWLETEIAKHVFSDGALPLYLVNLDSTQDPFLTQLNRRQHIEILHNLRESDLRRILRQLAQDINRLAERTRIAGQSANTVPPYNKNFSGRIEELLALRERLKSDRAGVVCGIHGLGGIGKSELAYAYAHAYAGVYPGGRFEIPCAAKATLREAVLVLADYPDFHAQISDEERKTPATLFKAVVRCLVVRLNRQGATLLVLDNVDTEAFLEPERVDELTTLGPRLHLLATTRLEAPPHAHWLTLGELPEQDALNLLEKQFPFEDPEEREAARLIVKRLGGFTLAIELTGAWLAAQKGSSNYRTLAKSPGLAQLDTLAREPAAHLRRHNHERRLTAILGPILDQLKPDEYRTMEFAAFLPADTVALPWLKALVEPIQTDPLIDPALIDPLIDKWKKAQARLIGLTLLTRNTTDEPWRVRVHRMVQEVVQSRMSDARRTECGAAVTAFVEARAAELENTTAWQTSRWELEPVEALANLWAENDNADAPWLLNQTASWWYPLAEWARTEPLLRRALAIDETSFGPHHPKVATDLNNLAQLLQATNRLDEAEPLMRRALAIDETSFGPHHPKVAIRLNNLAQLLQATNRIEEAEPLMRRALAVDETSYGPHHPNVAIDLNNLAALLQATNRIEEAEPLMHRALAIDETSFGPHHPRVARDLNNLAQLLQATNRLEEAEPPMRRALAIDETSYGPHHPKVARDLHNLALLLQATNRLEEAEPLIRRALAIDETSYGPHHPNVAMHLNNLAAFLQDTNRIEEAEPLMHRALAIDETSFGPHHPRVARDLNNLAQVLQATNRLEEAEPLMRRALVIDESSYGPHHPNVARDLNNLAQLLQTTNRLDEAELLMCRALAIDVTSYGPHHPNVARDLNNLAQLLQTTNRLDEAEPLMRRALAIDEASYGPHHPDVGRNLSNLAALLQATNRLDEAEPLMRRALAIDETSFGPHHPKVALDLNNLAQLLDATNRLGGAEPLMRRALAIFEKSYGANHPNTVTVRDNLAAMLNSANCPPNR